MCLYHIFDPEDLRHNIMHVIGIVVSRGGGQLPRVGTLSARLGESGGSRVHGNTGWLNNKCM